MIPLTHHGTVDQLTKLFKIYVAEYNFTTGGTKAIFVHQNSEGKRFIPTFLGVYSTTNSTSATLTLGQVSTAYTDIVTNTAVPATGTFRNYSVLIGGAQNRTSIATGTTIYSVLSAACNIRYYIAGFLV